METHTSFQKLEWILCTFKLIVKFLQDAPRELKLIEIV